jgi:LPS export ABC transporter protein LptC
MKWLNARNIVVFLMIVIAGGLLAMVVRNYRWFSPEEVIESIPRNIDFSLQRLSYTETRDGIRRWTLTADSAAHSIRDEATRIENIHMIFYDMDKMGDVVMTARSGEIDSAKGEVVVRGNVVIDSPQGYSVYSEQLHYLDESRLIRTGEPVRLVSEKMEMTGKGMILNVDDHTLVLLSDVHAMIKGRQMESRQ